MFPLLILKINIILIGSPFYIVIFLNKIQWVPILTSNFVGKISKVCVVKRGHFDPVEVVFINNLYYYQTLSEIK